MLNPFRWLFILLREFFYNTGELLFFFLPRKRGDAPPRKGDGLIARTWDNIAGVFRILFFPIRWSILWFIDFFRNVFELLRFINPLKPTKPDRVLLAGTDRKRTWFGFILAIPRIIYDDTIGVIILWRATKEPNPKVKKLALHRHNENQ